MGFFGGHIRALLDFLPHTTISRTLLMYLSFSQTAGIGEPRMPIHVYNLDGPFKAKNRYKGEENDNMWPCTNSPYLRDIVSGVFVDPHAQFS